MHGPEEEASAQPVANTSSSSSSSAMNALTLQTIKDQQDIIQRQQELTSTLKKRVEELEAYQRQNQQQAKVAATTSAPMKLPLNPSAGLPYAADVHVRRRLASAESEVATLRTRVAGLKADLDSAEEQLEAHQFHQRRQEMAWREQMEAATTKATAAAQLASAVDQRSERVAEQGEGWRREAEVRMYEATQWRSLATTIAQRLEGPDGRYAREQAVLIEESVRRYAARQAAAAGVNHRHHHHHHNADDGDTDSADESESRQMWSRTAQAPPPAHAASSISLPRLLSKGEMRSGVVPATGKKEIGISARAAPHGEEPTIVRVGVDVIDVSAACSASASADRPHPPFTAMSSTLPSSASARNTLTFSSQVIPASRSARPRL